MAEETAVTSYPVSEPYRSKLVKRTVQLTSRTFGRFKESTRRPINDKGYMFSLLTRSNPNIGGGMNSGDTMLIGGSDTYIQLLVGSVVTNGARAWGGGALRQQKDGNYYGLNRTEQDVLDADRFASEHNKDLCFSGITKSRGVVSGTPTYDAGTNLSTVTFLSPQGGSYYLREMEGRSFLFHHPTTFAAKGGTTPFVLHSVPTKTTAKFVGDVTGGTAIATNDIVVPTGTAGGASSVNKGIRNLEYMTPVTGDYFTADVDTQDKLRGIQYDLAGNEVTRAVLEYMDGLFSFNQPNNEMGTKGHTDLFSPTQRMKMLFQAEGAIRINSTDGSTTYNPKIEYRGWNGRPYFMDPHILDTNWFIFYFPEAYRYVQKEFGPWNYDGLTERAIPDSGSIRDALQKHYIAVDQVGHEDPRMNLMIINASTAGAALKTS
jgi:hypothetical protein